MAGTVEKNNNMYSAKIETTLLNVFCEHTMQGLVKMPIRSSLFSYLTFYQESRAHRFGHASFCVNQDFSLPSALANGNVDTMPSGMEALTGNASAHRKVPGDLNCFLAGDRLLL